MSVDPVQGSSSVIEQPVPDRKQHAASPPKNTDSDATVKVEISQEGATPPPLAIPEHEVKVVLDTRYNNTLVYQILDKQSGDVVLQLPPAEQLRGLQESQELLQRIAARGRSASGGSSFPPDKKQD